MTRTPLCHLDPMELDVMVEAGVVPLADYMSLSGGGVEADTRSAKTGYAPFGEKPQYGWTHWRGSRKRLNGLSPRPSFDGRIPEQPEAAHGNGCPWSQGSVWPARPSPLSGGGLLASREPGSAPTPLRLEHGVQAGETISPARPSLPPVPSIAGDPRCLIRGNAEPVRPSNVIPIALRTPPSRSACARLAAWLKQAARRFLWRGASVPDCRPCQWPALAKNAPRITRRGRQINQ